MLGWMWLMWNDMVWPECVLETGECQATLVHQA